jgi:hypothetical protein
VAEGARLESVFTRKGNVGSNPTLSAMFSPLISLKTPSQVNECNGGCYENNRAAHVYGRMFPLERQVMF